MGVISENERDSFISYSDYIFRPTPHIRFFWNDEEIVFSSLTSKFELKYTEQGAAANP